MSVLSKANSVMRLSLGATVLSLAACANVPQNGGSAPAEPTTGQRIDAGLEWLRAQGATLGDKIDTNTEAGKAAINSGAGPENFKFTATHDAIRPKDTTCTTDVSVSNVKANKANVILVNGTKSCETTVAPASAALVASQVASTKRPGASLPTLSGVGANALTTDYGYKMTRQTIAATIPHSACTYTFKAAAKKGADGLLTSVCPFIDGQATIVPRKAPAP